jgi:hypothetical protein
MRAHKPLKAQPISTSFFSPGNACCVAFRPAFDASTIVPIGESCDLSAHSSGGGRIQVRCRIIILSIILLGSSALAAGRKPNVIYFMSDELGFYEPSYMGNPFLQTPNIARTAAGGVWFTQALAGSSVCAPTRCCLTQQRHEFLYWGLNDWVAVRAGDWKAVQPGKDRDWELYDLSSDVSEMHDLAAARPGILSRLKKYAKQAHRPVEEDIFFDRTLHERDRQAKFGFGPSRQQANPVKSGGSRE